MTQTKKRIFLASSAELKPDRDQFEIFIGRKNKDWHAKGVFLELVMWEDFLDAMSQTRLQDEYDKAIKGCDIFVMLFWTKVGKYTEEEFAHAFKQFKFTSKPFVFTYFKDAPNSAGRDELTSLWAFQDKLKSLGHFQTVYKNVEGLQLHFGQQLDKLVANGFIEFNPDEDERAAGNTYNASLTGNGAIAQGKGAKAVGAGGVLIGGDNAGSVNTGTQVNTGGAYIGGSLIAGGDVVGRDKITFGVSPGELKPLFAPLLAAVMQHSPADKQAAAVQQVEELKTEAAKGKQADDKKMGGLIEGLAGMVPGAVAAVVSMFATPILGGIVGPVTEYVLGKLKGN